MKKQTRKIGVAGSFQNQLMGNNASEPVVGEGATLLSYSDRHAYEVIEVSADGLKCKIRKMDCKFIGQSYGDERYTYHSDVDGHVLELEWNDKRNAWVQVWYEVKLFKALEKKLIKEFGSWDYTNHLPNGIKFEDLWEPIPNSVYRRMKEIDGITKRYKVQASVSIIFGYMSEYQDPSF